MSENNIPRNRMGEAMAKCDRMGIDGLCERLMNGSTMTAIAGQIEVSIGSLIAWIAADAERSVRAHEARKAAAEVHVDNAQKLMEDAKNPFELQKARELGFHLRWKASKVNPRDFGDKLQVDQTTTVVNLSDDELDRRAAELEKRLGEAMARAIAPMESAQQLPSGG